MSPHEEQATTAAERLLRCQMVQPGRNSLTRFGVFELDRRSGELRKAGSRIRLQIQPLKVLIALLDEPGAVVTREELKRRIWPDESFGDFDHAVNVAVAKLRAALADSADTPRFIETLPRRGYRFIFPANTPAGSPDDLAISSPAPPQATTAKTALVPRGGVVAAMAVIVAAGAFAWWFFPRKAHPLTDKDTIVLADFTNRTGDTVFDGTLRQGLAVQLEQSPFLSLVSDREIQQTLQLMSLPADAKLTPEIARELCQRSGSTAYLSGSIASLGNQYVLGFNAVNCQTGGSLAEEQERATGKEQVLAALDRGAVKLRAKLGESLSMIQKFDTPLEMATTPSLEALQAYSLGRNGDFDAAVPSLQRAIGLDPKFAMAYGTLGQVYMTLGETRLGAENTKKAYDLRERVSEREKFYIDSHYHQNLTGDLEKARQELELWAQTYPRDWVVPSSLGVIYRKLGQYDKALEQFREAYRLNPSSLNIANVFQYYLALNRPDEARATAEEAQAKNLDSFFLRAFLYRLAFSQNDAAGMAQQVAWSAGKPGVEDVLLTFEADTAIYSGHLGKARELSRQAVASAERAKENEVAAGFEVDAALREALFGNAARARQRAATAVEPSSGRDVQYRAALALALAADASRAQALADDLGKRFPEDTVVRFNYLPTIHAQLALDGNEPSKAIEILQAAAPYELGRPGNSVFSHSLDPVYVRGKAFLDAHQGNEAAAEFQKILDHRGVVLNEPIGALAHLQIGRAYTMQGDTAKAKAAYQDFLTLWKDADPDIPILIAAKAEYAKLK